MNQNSQRNYLFVNLSLNLLQSPQPQPLAALALEQQSIRASETIKLAKLSRKIDEALVTTME
jgi:hypothetical protein